MENITLIGMPGSGKSTLGITLAEALGYHFIDTDTVIMETYGKPLMELIQENGNSGFIALEGKVIQSIHTNRAVIATGGSAVYSHDAMEYLRHEGMIVYLHHELKELISRAGNIVTRGVVCHGGCSTMDELFQERCPLYERYANFAVDLSGVSLDQCHELLLRAVKEHCNFV